MSEKERIFINYDQALALLPDGETIHTVLNPIASVLIGADWSRESVLELLRTSPQIEMTGEMAQKINHGIAAVRGNDYVFIETKKADQ